MLDEAEAAELDRLWAELHFVSQDALTLVDALQQLLEYATQDGDPRRVRAVAQADQRSGRRVSPRARRGRATSSRRGRGAWRIVRFAARSPSSEASELRELYSKLRSEEIPHDEAIRLVLARVLVAPAFLYRVEQPAARRQARARLRLGAGQPAQLFPLVVAARRRLRGRPPPGRLHRPDVLAAQARRMLHDPRSAGWRPSLPASGCTSTTSTPRRKEQAHFPTFAGFGRDARGVDPVLHRPVSE